MIFLEENNARGDVLLESRNKPDNKALEKIYKEIYCNGTKKNASQVDMTSLRFQSVLTSKSLKFKNKSENIAGLQIADLLANPLKCKLLLLEENLNTFSNFSELLYNKIENKIRSDNAGKKVGYGLVYCR